MLSGKGFKTVFNVSGGIKAWKSKTAIGSQELGMTVFSGKETPEEILTVAYSLEKGLCEFYVTLGKKSDNTAVKQLFDKLSEIEIKHQMSILEAYNQIADHPVTRDAFEDRADTEALEGGLSTQEYLERFQPDLNSPAEVISLAMSIEAQALDLYLRLSSKIAAAGSKQIINQIANEEKAHLTSLGKLMDELEAEK